MIEDDIEALEKEMLEELKRPQGRQILVCPVCGSTEVTYYMGLKTGYKYQCKSCNYVGPLVLEKEC
ncbi:MAG: transposase [Candidatus Methanoperedens sp.]|nr:transposase [Candidatus Methanoperedens sp.]